MEQKQNQNSQKNKIYPLNKNEENLIRLIKTKYRYGEIIVICHDGIPQRIKRVDVFDDLHGNLSNDLIE